MCLISLNYIIDKLQIAIKKIRKLELHRVLLLFLFRASTENNKDFSIITSLNCKIVI